MIGITVNGAMHGIVHFKRPFMCFEDSQESRQGGECHAEKSHFVRHCSNRHWNVITVDRAFF